MKIIFAIMLLFISSLAYADSNSVKAPGMTGYFVYEDGNGHKIVKHPTVPSIAYDLNGKKVEIADPTAFRKIATVKSDGTFVPMGGSDSGVFGTVSLLFMLAMLIGGSYFAWKMKNKWTLRKADQHALDRLKVDLDSLAHTLFYQFYKNLRSSKVDYIRNNTTETFFTSLQPRIEDASDFAEIHAKDIRNHVQSITRENGVVVATIAFTYTLTEEDDGKRRDISGSSLWTFHMINNKWLIAGAKELEPVVTSEWTAVKVKEEVVVETEKEMSATNKYSL